MDLPVIVSIAAVVASLLGIGFLYDQRNKLVEVERLIASSKGTKEGSEVTPSFDSSSVQFITDADTSRRQTIYDQPDFLEKVVGKRLLLVFAVIVLSISVVFALNFVFPLLAAWLKFALFLALSAAVFVLGFVLVQRGFTSFGESLEAIGFVLFSIVLAVGCTRFLDNIYPAYVALTLMGVATFLVLFVSFISKSSFLPSFSILTVLCIMGSFAINWSVDELSPLFLLILNLIITVQGMTFGTITKNKWIHVCSVLGSIVFYLFVFVGNGIFSDKFEITDFLTSKIAITLIIIQSFVFFSTVIIKLIVFKESLSMTSSIAGVVGSFLTILFLIPVFFLKNDEYFVIGIFIVIKILLLIKILHQNFKSDINPSMIVFLVYFIVCCSSVFSFFLWKIPSFLIAFSSLLIFIGFNSLEEPISIISDWSCKVMSSISSIIFCYHFYLASFSDFPMDYSTIITLFTPLFYLYYFCPKFLLKNSISHYFSTLILSVFSAISYGYFVTRFIPEDGSWFEPLNWLVFAVLIAIISIYFSSIELNYSEYLPFEFTSLVLISVSLFVGYDQVLYGLISNYRIHFIFTFSFILIFSIALFLKSHLLFLSRKDLPISDRDKLICTIVYVASVVLITLNFSVEFYSLFSNFKKTWDAQQFFFSISVMFFSLLFIFYGVFSTCLTVRVTGLIQLFLIFFKIILVDFWIPRHDLLKVVVGGVAGIVFLVAAFVYYKSDEKKKDEGETMLNARSAGVVV
ncbi:hypothetical protein RCL1_006574 [Eukaryota sp. TZLM3-RCL]